MDSNLKPLSTVEEINQEWIEKMLCQKLGEHVKVLSWSYKLPSGREGFLSEIAFLKVSYSTTNSKELDQQLVLKVLPKDPSVRQFMANGGLAKREIGFYTFINCRELKSMWGKSGIPLPIAETFFSGYTEEAITVVLQDLRVEKYKSVIVKDGSTLAQTNVALQAIAQIHAAGIVYLKENGELNENFGLGSEFNTDFYNQFLVPNLKTLVEMTKGTALSKVMMSLLPIGRSLFILPKRYPLMKTVIHGDLWAGQLLYSDDESRAKVIDWQFCRVDNPVIDILSMFFMSCDPGVLENHLDEILRRYWESLNRMVGLFGVSLDVTYEQFVKNVEDLWMFGFAFLVVSIHDFLNGDNISKERIFGAMKFLEKRGVFSKFVHLIESENSG